MNIKRILYIIKSTEPTLQQLKNAVSLLQILKTALPFRKKFGPPPPLSAPRNKISPPLSKVLVAPLLISAAKIH